MRRLIAFSAAAFILAAMGFSSATYAFPPSNDDIANATVISSLPFTMSENTFEASATFDDPTSCSNNGSVWFTFTASQNAELTADTFGSGYDTVLSAYTGTRGALAQVPNGCNDDFNGAGSRIAFVATAGTTYYFMVGQCCGYGGAGGGNLVFHLNAISPPPNDNFADATQVSSIPFSDSLDLTAATVEGGEPTPTCGSPPQGSVWYAFVPPASSSYVASITSFGYIELSVYTGSSLNALTGIACQSNRMVGFHADAGTTYFIQVSNVYGSTIPSQFSIAVAPPPNASFYFYPSDPSTFDTVQFYDSSYDPIGAGIASQSWDLGDGSSATGYGPTHRYATDGDYTARLEVVTSDGRVASTQRPIAVRTHDVVITKLSVPQTASVGQTRSIAVGISNLRYPETVEVRLNRSTASGYFDTVGILTQSVALRGGNRTTNFAFTYTFTASDAALGRITFQAVATIQGARDASPANNTVISLPTRVNGGGTHSAPGGALPTPMKQPREPIP